MTTSGAPNDSSTLAYRDDEHAIVVCQNAVLTYSTNGPSLRFLEAWADTVERVVTQFNGPLLAMTIIDKATKPPSEDSRRAIRNTLERHAARIDAFAYVVEGEGFGAAAVRSALSLITLAARFPFPLKVFGHVEEATPWMLSRPSRAETRAPGVTELMMAAESLRGHLRSVAATG